MTVERHENYASENFKTDEQKALKSAALSEVEPSGVKKQFEVSEGSSTSFSEMTEILFPKKEQ